MLSPEQPHRTKGNLLKKRVAASLVLALLLVLPGHASARLIFKERFHDEGTIVEKNHCGVAGLTVSEEFVADGKFQVVRRGRERLAYSLDRLKETIVITNLANRKVVTAVLTVGAKDLKVTNNGDGTLTIVVQAMGNVVVYGPDGKAIARDAGLSRFEVLIDHGGTPRDPSDDEFIDERRIKGPTGRNDDICAAVVPQLT